MPARPRRRRCSPPPSPARSRAAQVVNRLSVATPNQVDLQVRIAEVDRNILKQIGVDWSKLGRTYSFNTAINPGLTIRLINFLDWDAFCPVPSRSPSPSMRSRPRASSPYLAEPNLTAVSGQTASFLAGGEFPYPVAQPGSVGNTAVITIQFQQFGVQLAFTPTIIDADHLSLRVRPEVSQLDFTDAVTISRLSRPRADRSSAETTVELASGQSFALAGLLMHNTSQDISKVPWLGDIPILGALFRSNKFQNNESELVVIVTPYLVQPPATAAAAPTDGFEAPHDAQQVLWGDTWRREPAGAGARPARCRRQWADRARRVPARLRGDAS